MYDIEELIILLNNTCNLRCSYCTFREEQPERFVTLAPERMRKAMTLFFEQARVRPETPRIICFNADGEALLARDVLLDGIMQAARLRAESGANVLLALVTNATLVDRALAAELARQDMAVTVSLDGAAAMHDLHRVGPGDAPTHARVLAGIAALQAAGIPLSLRAVITPETAPALTETYHALQALGPARPIKLRPVRVAAPPLIPASWAETFAAHYLCCVETLLAEPGFSIAALPDDAYYYAHYLLTGAGRPAYCTAGRAMLWLTPTGHFTACGLFSQGEQQLGHIDAVDSTEALRALLAHPFAAQLRTSAPSTREPCRSCRWLPACGGGCPALPGAQAAPPLCAFYAALGTLLERLLADRPREQVKALRTLDV